MVKWLLKFSVEVEIDSDVILTRLRNTVGIAQPQVGVALMIAAKSLLVYRAYASRPGQPPSSHTGKLRDGINWRFEPSTGKIILGVEVEAGSWVPTILEFGGTSLIKHFLPWGGVQMRTVRIEPRPYLRPALDRVLPQIPKIWANAVSRS